MQERAQRDEKTDSERESTFATYNASAVSSHWHSQGRHKCLRFSVNNFLKKSRSNGACFLSRATGTKRPKKNSITTNAMKINVYFNAPQNLFADVCVPSYSSTSSYSSYQKYV